MYPNYIRATGNKKIHSNTCTDRYPNLQQQFMNLVINTSTKAGTMDKLPEHDGIVRSLGAYSLRRVGAAAVPAVRALSPCRGFG